MQQHRDNREENREWVSRMKDDLERQGSGDGGFRPATIFRVPTVLREVSQDSYNPKYLSFGPYNRSNSSLYTIRLNFVRVFQKIIEKEWKKIMEKEWKDIYSEDLHVDGKLDEKITEKEWKDIYSEVLHVDGKLDEDTVEHWMKLYDGLKKDDGKKDVEQKEAKEEPKPFLAWEEETGKIFLAWDAIFVVCFLLADHYRNCSGCRENFSFLDPLRNEIEKETVAPLVHLIRLDIFKFENQIPLGLIKNVFGMISRVYTQRSSLAPSQTRGGRSTPDLDHKVLSFDKFVTDAVCSIYCDLPRPASLKDFRDSMKTVDFEKAEHLLQCLYLVVCYKLPKPSENQNSKNRKHARSIFQSPAKKAGRTGGRTGGVDEESQRSTGGASTSRTPRDEERPPHVRCWFMNLVPWTMLSCIFCGIFDKTSNGGGESSSSARARPDKGKSPVETELVDFSQDNNGGNGAGTTVQAQLYPGESSRQGGADPSQITGSNGGASTSRAEQDKGRSPKGDARHTGQSDGESAAPTNWFMILFAWTLRCISFLIFCKLHDDPRHNHFPGIPTITNLRAANITVKVGRHGNETKWISEVNFRARCCKGELYLPVFGLYDETQTLLRNLLAYEYTVLKKKDLLSFIHLLNNLITTEEDVKWMKESGVLKNNSLGSEKKVAEMWNTMLSGVVIILSRHYQFNVFDEIGKHRKKRILRGLGQLKLLYDNKWKIVGIIAASLTIAATLVAMFYTIITYYYGNKQRATT